MAENKLDSLGFFTPISAAKRPQILDFYDPNRGSNHPILPAEVYQFPSNLEDVLVASLQTVTCVYHFLFQFSFHLLGIFSTYDYLDFE